MMIQFRKYYLKINLVILLSDLVVFYFHMGIWWHIFYFLRFFLLFSICEGKIQKTWKIPIKMILTSKQCAKHPFAGQNTQQFRVYSKLFIALKHFGALLNPRTQVFKIKTIRCPIDCTLCSNLFLNENWLNAQKVTELDNLDFIMLVSWAYWAGI